MSRAFLIAADRLAFITVLLISRMIASSRLDRIAIRNGLISGAWSCVDFWGRPGLLIGWVPFVWFTCRGA